MGIAILPILLTSFVIVFLSLISIFKLLKSKEISLKELIFGLILSLLIFGLIVLSYLFEGNAYVLDTAFRIPIFMIYIPFIIHLRTKKSLKLKTKYISNLLLISVGITGILGIIFHDLYFGLAEYLGIEIYNT